MEWNFSNNINRNNREVNIKRWQSEYFRYLGVIIVLDEEVGDDMIHRIKIGWLKWRSVSGTLCECLATNKHVHKMSIAEMKILRLDECMIWLGKIVRNEYICELVREAPREEKLRANKLRWFVHVQRRFCWIRNQNWKTSKWREQQLQFGGATT